jgi:hypothetical protein
MAKALKRMHPLLSAPNGAGNFTEQELALVDVELAPANVLPMAGRAG